MSRIRRRRLLLAAAAVVASPLALAQQARRIPTIGLVHNVQTPTPEQAAQNPLRRAFVGRLRELGWRPESLRARTLYSEGHAERVAALTEELVRERVDLLIAGSTISAVSAARATKTIPIVLAGSSAYCIEVGLIKSYSKPGGNITGVAYWQGIEVQSKLAQFVREILPEAKRLAWIASPADLIKVDGGEFKPEPYYAKISQSLGFELSYYEWRKADDIEPVFAATKAQGAQAAVIEPANLSFDARFRIAQAANGAGLPSFYSATWNVPAGGLLAYSPLIPEIWSRTAEYVDRILRGARPAELPVEMPSKLELAVNMKTASALGLTIPQSILLRADQVIE